MVTISDFITIPYTPDMTQAGIKYACQSLPYTYDRMGGNRIKRLRRIVAGKAVELAFKRYLNQREIPHDMLGSTPYTEPDHYDIAIGGRCCDIKSFVLTQKKRIREIRQSPQRLLDAQALVPVDQLKNEHFTDDDIYIFSFLSALITPNQRSLEKAANAQQPLYMLHALPKRWARPEKWATLGKLAVKSNMENQVKLEFGGQNEQHKFQTEHLILNPKTRMHVKQPFTTLSYLHTPNFPEGTIGIHSSALDETYLVEPLEWSNIWIYGLEIVFCGYMTRGEFRKKATRIGVGCRVFQYARTRTENLSLPIRNLHPLNTLFSKATDWERAQIS
jgi:hypothetical protein